MEKLDARKFSTAAYQQLRNQAIQIKKRGRLTGSCRTLTTEQEKDLQIAMPTWREFIKPGPTGLVGDCGI